MDKETMNTKWMCNKAGGFIACILLLFASCLSDDSDDVENYVVAGDVIPDFVITGSDGAGFDSSALTGKKTALVFFHTGCPDCARELPVVEKAWNELKDDPDVVFIAIARGQTAVETDAYWEKHQLTIPKFNDPQHAVFELFANRYVPRLYLINPERVIQWMGIETFNLTPSELAEKVRRLGS